MKIEDLPVTIRKRIIVDAITGCWIWTGYCTPKNYGLMWFDGKTQQVKRVVARLAGLPVEQGTVEHACHSGSECPGGVSCPHRPCSNPAHFKILSIRDNVLAGKTGPAQNLAKTRCPNDHSYDKVDRRGWRKCSTCENARKRERRRGFRAI